MTLAHNLRSRVEVDEVLDQAASAGAVITLAARETFYGGYAGFFTDPDGHVWEVAYNPASLSTGTVRSRFLTSAGRRTTAHPRWNTASAPLGRRWRIPGYVFGQG